MPETIESFVAKLQAEGVEAGKQAADQLEKQAREAADKIVADAKAQAGKIVADANAEAEALLARARGELRLAARDAVLKLRERLGGGLRALLQEAVRDKLSDVEFIGEVLHELIQGYAKQDQMRGESFHIRVRDDLRNKLTKWALSELGHDLSDEGHMSIDLKGNLRQAGFEYEIEEGTVEVTQDAVVEVLQDMVAPALRELLDEAMTEQGDANSRD